MEAPDIQNILLVFTIGTSLWVANYSGKQSKRALNVDINFRALENRKKLFTQLQSSLNFFTNSINYLGEYSPPLKESELYDAHIYEDDQEDQTGPWIVDIGDLLRQQEAILDLLIEATLIFPKAEKEIKYLCNQLAKFVKVINMDDKTSFYKEQNILKKNTDIALGIMKNYLKISHFTSLEY